MLQPGLENIRTGLDQARTLGEEQFARVLEDERTRDVVVGLITQGGERGIRDGLALIQGEGLQPLRAAIKDDTRTVEAIAGFIGRGDEESIRTGLELIEPFDTNWQRVVKDQPKAKTAIIDLYVDRMYQNILPEERKFDYAHAGRELAALEALYPDSADVFRIRNELKAHKEAELGKLNILYTQLLDAGKLIVDESEGDVGDIIALVEGIDPTHPMLKDPNLPVRYREQVNAAVSANDYQRADLILQAGAVHAPDDVELANLSHDVAAELRRQADEKLASEIQQRLQAQRQSFTNLDDFAGARTDLIKLAELSPSNALLAEITDVLEGSFRTEFAATLAPDRFTAGEALLLRFAPLMRVGFVTEQRVTLSVAEAAAGFEPRIDAAARQAIVALEQQIADLLAEPDLSISWEIRLRAPFKELVARQAGGDSELSALRERIGRWYLENAAESRAKNHFPHAFALIERGRVFNPSSAKFDAESQRTADAREALRKQQEEERRLARIANLKRTLLAKAEANQPKDAKALLADLAKELPADDAFLADQGPAAIGGAYLRLAETMAQRDDLDAAVSFARSGLEVAPQLAPLKGNYIE